MEAGEAPSRRSVRQVHVPADYGHARPPTSGLLPSPWRRLRHEDLEIEQPGTMPPLPRSRHKDVLKLWPAAFTLPPDFKLTLGTLNPTRTRWLDALQEESTIEPLLLVGAKLNIEPKELASTVTFLGQVNLKPASVAAGPRLRGGRRVRCPNEAPANRIRVKEHHEREQKTKRLRAKTASPGWTHATATFRQFLRTNQSTMRISRSPREWPTSLGRSIATPITMTYSRKRTSCYSTKRNTPPSGTKTGLSQSKRRSRGGSALTASKKVEGVKYSSNHPSNRQATILRAGLTGRTALPCDGRRAQSERAESPPSCAWASLPGRNGRSGNCWRQEKLMSR